MPVQITNLTQAFWTGLTSGFSQLMNFIPSLLGATLIFIAGWFVSKFIGHMVERVLVKAKLETAMERSHVTDYLPSTSEGKKGTFSAFVGGVVKWFLFLIFIQAAANVLGVVQVSGIINSIVLFIPNVLVASAIIVFGSWGAHYFAGIVQKSSSNLGLRSPNLPANLVRYGIMGFAVIAAVGQLGIATNLINILFTGLVASLAIAFGLAFGLGGQGAASEITRSLMDNSRTYSEKIRSQNEEEQLPH